MKAQEHQHSTIAYFYVLLSGINLIQFYNLMFIDSNMFHVISYSFLCHLSHSVRSSLHLLLVVGRYRKPKSRCQRASRPRHVAQLGCCGCCRMLSAGVEAVSSEAGARPSHLLRWPNSMATRPQMHCSSHIFAYLLIALKYVETCWNDLKRTTFWLVGMNRQQMDKWLHGVSRQFPWQLYKYMCRNRSLDSEIRWQLSEDLFTSANWKYKAFRPLLAFTLDLQNDFCCLASSSRLPCEMCFHDFVGKLCSVLQAVEAVTKRDTSPHSFHASAFWQASSAGSSCTCKLTSLFFAPLPFQQRGRSIYNVKEVHVTSY